jgi:hypothetical protein
VGSFGNEISPLTCFGYRVGKTNGKQTDSRQQILRHTLFADIPNWIFPTAYISGWGKPGSLKRFEKIIKHIKMLADQREGRKNYEVAVSEWQSDITWFKKRFSIQINKFNRFI